MRIKHTTLMAGPAGCFPAGTERDVDDREGRALVAGNYAVEVKRRMPEAAVGRPRETAAEQTAAASLANIAGLGRRISSRKKSGGMTPAQDDEAARDAYAGRAPAAVPSAPTPDDPASTDASTSE